LRVPPSRSLCLALARPLAHLHVFVLMYEGQYEKAVVACYKRYKGVINVSQKPLRPAVCVCV